MTNDLAMPTRCGMTGQGSFHGTRPILLSGVYRSGTTFLAAVLNNLPNVAAASSTVKYLRFCSPHHQNLHDEVALTALLDEIAARLRVRWSITLDTGWIRRILYDRPRNHAVVYDAVMKALFRDDKPEATRWAEKLAMQWRDIPCFLDMFPQGQVIHVFRDPRDVTASYKNMTYEPWPAFMDAALNCKAAMIEVPRVRSSVGADRVLMLRAEDLATDLEDSTKVICEFLGEPYGPELAQLDRFEDIKGENWRTNSSFDEHEPNYAKASSRWTKHLTPEELFLVEMICQPEMAAFDYAGSGQDLTALCPKSLQVMLSDPWFAARLGKYLMTGLPDQGYRSDPYKTEMDIVFGAARNRG